MDYFNHTYFCEMDKLNDSAIDLVQAALAYVEDHQNGR